MIAVIDYKKGNIRSVVRGLERAGAHVRVIDGPDVLARATSVVLPGVGAFRDAMESLEELGMVGPLMDAIADGVPYLGICLGMHILFEGGMEHAEDGVPHRGLGIMPGIVGRLPAEGFGPDGITRSFKLPHVGWNTVDAVAFAERIPSYGSDSSLDTAAGSSPDVGLMSGAEVAFDLLDGLPQEAYFYFTHSYACPDSPYTAAVTTHSVAFPSIVRKGDTWGVQFHPEKSSAAGTRLLQNFVEAYE